MTDPINFGVVKFEQNTPVGRDKSEITRVWVMCNTSTGDQYCELKFSQNSKKNAYFRWGTYVPIGYVDINHSFCLAGSWDEIGPEFFRMTTQMLLSREEQDFEVNDWGFLYYNGRS